MKELKIDFSDFWPGFIKDNNYFFNLLSLKYNVTINDNPDVLFFSSYGDSYLNYKCSRIFYSAENEKADFSACDLALTFDHVYNDRHFRLPLYVLHIDRANNLSELTSELSKEKALEVWNSKKKFCCMVVSNGNAKERIHFFNDISSFRKVDSGGRFMNNVGGPVKNKLEFIKDYKFVISYENSVYSGYTTEKILEPYFVNSIPVYWGNPEINKDFNPSTFINASNFNANAEVLDLMTRIENDSELAISYLCPPKIEDVSEKKYFNKDKVLSFIEKGIGIKHPVASSFFLSFKHQVKRKWRSIDFYFIKYTVGHFR